MKAYEFYVLLGKYKRKSMTRAEYDRFIHAMHQVRRYRHAFYDSTGQYPKSLKAYKARRSKQPVAVSEEDLKVHQEEPSIAKIGSVSPGEFDVVRRGSSKAASESSKVAAPTQHPEKDMVRSHMEFRRVRGHHRKSRNRWFRLGKDLARHHPGKIFAGLVFITGLLLVGIMKPGFSDHVFSNNKETDLAKLTADANAPKASIGSLASGRVLSEADQLLNVDVENFQLSATIETSSSVEVPITGLEQAIQEGLEERFPEPKLEVDPVEVPSTLE